MFDVSAVAVFDAQGCLAFLREHTVDLILLDINLEKSSGFDLCRTLRETTQIPILFISARQSTDDEILALNIGGDDYIRKPYSLAVLLVKVKAVLKRHANKALEPYKVGNLVVDFVNGRALVNDEVLKLKAQEFKLLCYLIQNRGRVLTKGELFREVWDDTITSNGTLNVHIRHLREKLRKHLMSRSLLKPYGAWDMCLRSKNYEDKRIVFRSCRPACHTNCHCTQHISADGAAHH